MKQIRNIGIFAHVDAGKTTLTERLLFHAGAIRRAGSVDQGTAHTDRLDVERRRGISVRATCTALSYNGIRINLIDTPGHADFSSEVERSMWALDGAVLVLSAKEGVEAQTETVFKMLQARGIPMLLFINKIDREGADPDRVLKNAQKKLSRGCFLLNDTESAMEALADHDDAAAEAYLDGEIYSAVVLRAKLLPQIHAGRLCPVLTGSALRDIGVDALLDAVCTCLPAPSDADDEPLSGVVFALENDPVMGRAAYVRLYSGTLENRQTITMPVKHSTEYTMSSAGKSERSARSERCRWMVSGGISVPCTPERSDAYTA